MKTPSDMITGYTHNTKNGLIEIVKYHNRNSVDVKFVASGFSTRCKSQTVREGRLTDRGSATVLGVATIGEGKYKNTINYKTTDSYKCWIGIIYRCYNPSCDSYHRYGGRGVKVCSEWLNFQNFAAWYEDNYPQDGKRYQIDKDIKIEGNTVYSPDACIFVNAQQNTEKAMAKSFIMKNPDGEVVEIYNMAKFCRENGLTKSGLHRVYRGGRKSHKGWTRAY